MPRVRLQNFQVLQPRRIRYRDPPYLHVLRMPSGSRPSLRPVPAGQIRAKYGVHSEYRQRRQSTVPGVWMRSRLPAGQYICGWKRRSFGLHVRRSSLPTHPASQGRNVRSILRSSSGSTLRKCNTHAKGYFEFWARQYFAQADTTSVHVVLCFWAEVDFR